MQYGNHKEYTLGDKPIISINERGNKNLQRRFHYMFISKSEENEIRYSYFENKYS